MIFLRPIVDVVSRLLWWAVFGGGNDFRDRCVIGEFAHVEPFWETEIVIIARNSHGSKRVPWGTPAGTSNRSDTTPFSFTLCCLLLRKSITQFTTVGFTPRLRSLATNIWWSTRSKAFLKSNRAVLTVEPVPSQRVANNGTWRLEQTWCMNQE